VFLADVEQTMQDFLAGNPLNAVPDLGGLLIYDTPLVAAAAADDALFEQLKQPVMLGPRHMSPGEWMSDVKTIITYFLPYTAEVRTANRTPGLPAPEWLYGRIEGEEFNNALRRHLIGFFAAAGCRAMAPALDERFSVAGLISNWSERHAAFIAGLGTFSLNASLITKAGAAGRLGSVLVNTRLEPTPRPYTQRDEYCTGCGACIARCPAGAVTAHGKEHRPCAEFLEDTRARFRPRYGCGKCQTAVPCEAKIP